MTPPVIIYRGILTGESLLTVTPVYHITLLSTDLWNFLFVRINLQHTKISLYLARINIRADSNSF